jgi:hypothetical protein
MDGTFLLPEVDEAGGTIPSALVSADWVAEQARSGELVLFTSPLPARPGHWLLQIEAGKPPELLAPDKARERLQEAGESALREVEQAVRSGDRAWAERRAWYSSRALPRHALPLVALVWLLERANIPEDEIAIIQEDLSKLPVSDRDRAWNTFNKWLHNRQSQGSRPEYLQGLPDEPGFLETWKAWGKRSLASI